MPDQHGSSHTRTTLVGRTRDLRELSLLATNPEVQLITICGAGGIGKTRLAIELIEVVRPDFDEAIFVDLVPITSPDLLPERILSAIGSPLPESGSIEEALIALLSERQMLLVLDNLEHLLAAAPFINRLLTSCPDVVIVTTMRERLGIEGEHLFEIAPLATPDQHGSQDLESIAASEAVQLFVQRAREVDRTYALTAENAGDVAAICRRLDGLPLAIELAASRVSDIPPRLILRNFTRILPFLERTAFDPEGRHRTMRNAIEWSYQLLSNDERRLFRQLSIFESGCSLEGAAAIGRAPDSTLPNADTSLHRPDDVILLTNLGALVDKHFLTRHNWNEHQPRFGMLETIREFGRERLASEDEEIVTRNRHAQYAIIMAETFRGHLQGDTPGEWLDRYDTEIDEFRAAFNWLLSLGQSEAERALVLGNRLDYYWGWRGHAREGSRWIALALEQTEDTDTVERATAYLNLGNLTLSDLDASSRHYEASLRILRKLDHKVGIAGLLSSLGLNAEQRGEFNQAMSYLNESMDRFIELGFDSGVALCSFHLGTLAGFQGDYSLAIDRLDESRTLYDQLNDAPGALFAMIEMGRFYRLWNRYTEASDILTWALERLEIAKIAQGIRHARTELGWVSLSIGNTSRALEQFRDVIQQSIGSATLDGFSATAIRGAAELAIRHGDAEPGVALISATERWQSMTRTKPPIGDQAIFRAQIDHAKQSLGDDTFERAWRLGAFMSIEDAGRKALDAMLAHDTLATPPAIERTSSVQAKPNFNLTPQERTVLCIISRGETNRRIAEELSISERTVAVHVQNILRKLDADNRTHAASIAHQAGMCQPSSKSVT